MIPTAALLLWIAQTGLGDCPVGYADKAAESFEQGKLKEADALLQLAETCEAPAAQEVNRGTEALIHRQHGVVQALLAIQNEPQSRLFGGYASAAVISFYRALKKNSNTRLTGDKLPPLVVDTFKCALSLANKNEADLPAQLWPCPTLAPPPAPPPPTQRSDLVAPPPPVASKFSPKTAFWVSGGAAVLTGGISAGLAVYTSKCEGCDNLDQRVLVTNIAWGTAATAGLATAVFGIWTLLED